MTTAARRAPLLVLGAAGLLGGLAAGLARLGIALPGPALAWAALHGPLMICAFFGTLISLERAVALKRPWGTAAPILAGAGGLALLGGAPGTGAWLIAGGSLVFLAMALVVYWRQAALYTATLALGALAWAAPSLLWAGGTPVPALVPGWAAFLILTIAGERLELTRFQPPRRHRTALFLVPLTLLTGSAVTAPLHPDLSWALFGPGALLTALWMITYDIARRTAQAQGLTRFTGIALLSGYGWLLIGGLLLLTVIGPYGPVYDAALHAVFVGFVFSMVFGHAPIILPSILRVDVPYHPALYGPLSLLHLSLALRVLGDLADLPGLRLTGASVNVLAILGFIATVAVTARLRARRA